VVQGDRLFGQKLHQRLGLLGIRQRGFDLQDLGMEV
jgi:hypothetical protein